MIPTVEQSLTLIKSALAVVPLTRWDERVALCLAVQILEKELSNLASAKASVPQSKP